MLCVVASLLVTVQGSWYEWLWAPELPLDSCRTIIGYAYNSSQFSVDLVNYLTKTEVVLDPKVSAGIAALSSFIHEKTSPCIKSQLGSSSPFTTEPNWKEMINSVLASKEFLLAIPGILALIIILVQCFTDKLCKERNYRLLRKK